METTTMGRVLVTAKIENLNDLYDAIRGLLPDEQVRRVEVSDALVDTGASNLSMPRRLIAQLGLRPFRKRQAHTSAGPVNVQIYESVRLTIQGRDCSCEVIRATR